MMSVSVRNTVPRGTTVVISASESRYKVTVPCAFTAAFLVLEKSAASIPSHSPSACLTYMVLSIDRKSFVSSTRTCTTIINIV